MPIVHFVNNKSQSAGGMKTVLGYVSQEKKTVREDRKYVTGINCSTQSAYEEMMLTKKVYSKTGGRLYYHLVQSFPKGYEIDPALAHKIACEFAEKAFGKYECVVATHIDREHIHSHIVFNSVSFQDGRKYHSNLDSVKELMKLSDEICQRYGVSVLDDPAARIDKKKVTKMSDREYRSRQKEQGWKDGLELAIASCMKVAKSNKQFCFLMKHNFGYDVRWEDNRKYITYTTPSGYRCRDKRLHNEKYLKEAMENEFRIRSGELPAEETTGWEQERRYYQRHIEMQIGADIVSGLADLATIIDNSPADPEELERYIDSVIAVQNAGFVIGFVVEAIKLLSEQLEEMNAGMEDELEYDEGEGMSMM